MLDIRCCVVGLQAHAWVALGKLCLTDEPLAKKCVPLLVQQLKAAKAPAVRNNIMVALADLCVQYTALVDTHLPRLAACLSDPNELVRRQALALLANLLQKVTHVWTWLGMLILHPVCHRQHCPANRHKPLLHDVCFTSDMHGGPYCCHSLHCKNWAMLHIMT